MEKQLRIALVPLLLFVGFFLTAGYLNRYASDDFEFLSKYHLLGFAGSVEYFYDHWNTRWLAISFMNMVFIITSAMKSLMWYHVLSLTLLWISFYRICFVIVDGSKLQHLIISGFSVVCFFYSCFSISDVFFWINTSTMYLFGTIAFLFAMGELINRKNSFAGYVILITSGIYLGGAYEPLVFTVLVGGAIYLFSMFKINGTTVVQKPSVLKTIILISVLMIAFAISYAGEGHVIRSSFLPQTTIPFKLWVLVKSIIKMVFIFLPMKLLIAIPLSLPWFILAIWKPFHKVTLKIVMLATAGLILLCAISMVPLAFVMSEMGPERAWTQVSVFITAFAALIAAYLGTRYGLKFKSTPVIPVAVALVSLFICIVSVIQIRRDIFYVNAFDARMEMLTDLKEKNTTGVVSLEPLPESGWLHSSEISETKDHFTNVHLKNYLQLKFDIRKEPGVFKSEKQSKI